ncbi:Sorting nexin-11 [Heterocephalus glaber]|uniref:Sorting nexin-11 n=1 Tax=Heterocephalus glaber TaxID=10181 RepID=G5BB13_HETGA|nr:Sorting nexin-11 [Heterocephalus glaber]
MMNVIVLYTYNVPIKEKKKKGHRQDLQHFLGRGLQSVVLLSDSQLHLFLQSLLSVPEIEACIQGRSPTTVAEDAILTYAMSN